MRPYRCVNPDCAEGERGFAGYDFLAKEPVCPKCGASLNDKDSRDLIVALQFVHLDVPGKWHKGTGTYACTKARFKSEPATGFASLVTCPACKLTPEWKGLLDKQGWEAVQEISEDRATELQAAAALVTRPKTAAR